MRAFSTLFLVLGLATAFGCGGGGGEGPTYSADGDADDDGDYHLEFVTGPNISVGRGAQKELTVRYIDPKGDPASGDVWFDIEGDAGGATLDSQGNAADSYGEATVRVRGGQDDANFDVVVSADYVDPIKFRITVAVPEDGGELKVSLSYEGVRRLHGADIYLYEGRDCEGIDPQSPPPADLLQSVQSIRDDATFAGLQAGSRWAVFAAAVNDSGNVAAFGCWPEAEIAEGEETTLDLPLQDIPIDSAGRWELENHFDVSEALPEGIENVFNALDEMSDDPNDPATYILDKIREQIDNDPLRFAFDAGRIYFNLDETLNEQIMNAAPGFVTDALGAGGDLARALNNMQIDSDMMLSDPDEFGVIYADHTLIDMVITLDGVTNRFSMTNDVHVMDATATDIMVGVEDESTLDIDRHQFNVGLGTLVLFSLNNVILPRFDGSPESLSDLLENAVDCGGVSEMLDDAVDMGSQSTWETLCGFALSAASLYAEQQLLGMNDRFDTLTLEGTAEIKDPNGDMGFDRLDNGVWESTWSGPATSVEFPGTFEGDRY